MIQIVKQPRPFNFVDTDAFVLEIQLPESETAASCEVYAAGDDTSPIVPAETKLADADGRVRFFMKDIIKAALERTELNLNAWLGMAALHKQLPDGGEFSFKVLAGSSSPPATGNIYALQGGFESPLGDDYYHFVQSLVLLTNQPLRKRITPAQPERLYVFAASSYEDASIQIHINYLDGERQSVNIPVNLQPKHTCVIDCSYATLTGGGAGNYTLEKSPEQVVSYSLELTAEGIALPVQVYQIDRYAQLRDTRIFAWQNQLGKVDHADMVAGTVETTLDAKRKLAVVRSAADGSEQRGIRSTAYEKTYKATTGYRTPEELAWLAELFTAPRAWEYFPDRGVYKEIVIKAGKHKTQLAGVDGKLGAHAFTYQYKKVEKTSYTNPLRAVPQTPPSRQIPLSISLDTSAALAVATLRWEPYTFAASYEIWMGVGGNGNPADFVLVNTVTSASSYARTLDQGGTTYYFQIRANPLGKASTSSAVVSADTPQIIQLTNIIMLGDLMFLWDEARQQQKLYRFAWDANLGGGVLDAPDNYLYISIGGKTFGKQRGKNNPTLGSAASVSKVYYLEGEAVPIRYYVRHLETGQNSEIKNEIITVPPRP